MSSASVIFLIGRFSITFVIRDNVARFWLRCLPPPLPRLTAPVPCVFRRSSPNAGQADCVLLLRQLVHDYQLRRSDVNDNVSLSSAVKFLCPVDAECVASFGALCHGNWLLLFGDFVEHEHDRGVALVLDC